MGSRGCCSQGMTTCILLPPQALSCGPRRSWEDGDGRRTRNLQAQLCKHLTQSCRPYYPPSRTMRSPAAWEAWLRGFPLMSSDLPFSPVPSLVSDAPFSLPQTHGLPASWPCDILLKTFPTVTSHTPAYATDPLWVWMEQKDHGLIIGGRFL